MYIIKIYIKDKKKLGLIKVLQKKSLTCIIVDNEFNMTIVCTQV